MQRLRRRPCATITVLRRHVNPSHTRSSHQPLKPPLPPYRSSPTTITTAPRPPTVESGRWTKRNIITWHSLTHATAAALSCHEHRPHSLARGRTDCYRTNCSIDNTGVARGAAGVSRTGRHLLGAANGRKLFIKIHVKIQIV